MIARPWSALFVVLMMLRLTFVGADFACAQHGGQSGVAHASESQDPHAAHSTTETAATEQPCELPALPECCTAMASCAVNLVLEGAEQTTSAFMREAVAVADSYAPRSRVTAPDPPPPKA
jgi:hypothetical protein